MNARHSANYVGVSVRSNRYIWISVFYMERLPILLPQPSYWATRYLLLRLGVRLPGFWLSITTVKDLRLRAETNGFTCFSRHGGVTSPSSELRAASEKFLVEKHNNTFARSGNRTQEPTLISRVCDNEDTLIRYKVFKISQESLIKQVTTS